MIRFFRFFRRRKVKVLSGNELEEHVKSHRRIMSFQSHLKYEEYVPKPIDDEKFNEKLEKFYELHGLPRSSEDMKLLKIELDKILEKKRSVLNGKNKN